MFIVLGIVHVAALAACVVQLVLFREPRENRRRNSAARAVVMAGGVR